MKDVSDIFGQNYGEKQKKQNKNRRNDEGTGEKLNAAWIKNTVI